MITYVISPKEANFSVLTFFSFFLFTAGSKNNFHHSAYEAGLKICGVVSEAVGKT